MAWTIQIDRKAIGRRIAKARKEREWTQRMLGERVGVKENSVALWEGGFRLPTIPRLVLLSGLLRRSLDHLLMGVPRRGMVHTLLRKETMIDGPRLAT